MPFQGCAIPGPCHSRAVPCQLAAPQPRNRHATAASCTLLCFLQNGWLETSPLPHRVEIRPGIHSSFGQGEEVGRRENAESVLREWSQRVPELCARPGSWGETSPCAEMLLCPAPPGIRALRLLGSVRSCSQADPVQEHCSQAGKGFQIPPVLWD